MRIFLLLSGLAMIAVPAFGQSNSGLGNYSFGTVNGGMRDPGSRPKSDLGLGGSSLGNGNIDTGYGLGSTNAATGLPLNGSGLSEGASALPGISSPPREDRGPRTDH